MATFGSKHGKREQFFFMKSFNNGYMMEVAPSSLPITALSKCLNMQYYADVNADGSVSVKLRKRRGTQKISTSAISGAVKACTYYLADEHYIIATSEKLYELDNSTFAPSEIGTIEGVPTFTEFHGKLIIHDGGVTKAWNGTTFETLTCLYQDEVIETGNGSDVSFSGTLAHPVVTAGTLEITYTDTTAKTITDNGDGTLAGDCTVGTINYTTGDYTFTCTGAPDNTTSVYAEYEMVSGAPKSKAGLVRGSRLYMWGDPDYPSRVWYSGPNDEDAWDTSSGGGYLDVDANDGYSLTGCVNFFTYLLPIKGNSVHLIADYPGDTNFGVKPLLQNTGALAYRTILNDGQNISFLSKEGWMTIAASDEYGDVKKTGDLSAAFREDAIKYSTTNCFADYNQIDNELWLTLYNGSNIHPYVYVINKSTGGSMGRYKFAFAHSCYKYINNEMLIGGADGNLYRQFTTSFPRYDDNAVAYTSSTYFRTACTNWNAPFNRKHNKRLFIHCYGKSGMTATLNLYKDGEYYTPFYTTTITLGSGTQQIYGDTTEIYGDTGLIASDKYSSTSQSISKKFNYSEIMVEITNISGSSGAEFSGFDFTGAILGGRLGGDF
jgi:hypothetical protein